MGGKWMGYPWWCIVNPNGSFRRKAKHQIVSECRAVLGSHEVHMRRRC